MIDEPRKETPGKAVVLLGVIFLLGMVVGASFLYLGQRSVSSQWTSGDGESRGPDDRGPHVADGPGGERRGGRRPPRDGRPPSPLEDMTQRLELTHEQQQQIRGILDTYRGRMDSMLEESRLSIRGVLTEEQAQRFDTMRPPRPGRRDGPPGPRRKGPRRKGPPRQHP